MIDHPTGNANGHAIHDKLMRGWRLRCGPLRGSGTRGHDDRTRAAVVSGTNLARWAAALGLGELVRLGRGEDQTGGRARESILATTLEAVLGVLYLEGGLDAVRRAIDTLAPDTM